MLLKFFKKSKVKKILSILLSVLICIGVVAGSIKLIQFFTKTDKSVSPSFCVGSLDSTGKYDKSDTSKSKIYTKDYFECIGLKITPDFDSEVTYYVYLYDKDGKFLKLDGTSGYTTQTYEMNNNFARYARVVIKPDNDDNILFYEVYQYSKQITIEVSKNQTFVDVTTKDLFPTAIKTSDKQFGTKSVNNSTYAEKNNSTGYTCLELNCVNFEKIKFVSSDSTKFLQLKYGFVNSDDYKLINLSSTQVSNYFIEVVNSSSLTQLEICVPTGATKLLVFYSNTSVVPHIYQTK